MDATVWGAVGEGVAGSLVAIGIVEIYRLMKRRLSHRRQRRVWQVTGSTLEVLAPMFRGSRPQGSGRDIRGGLLGIYDSIGIAHLLAAGLRIGLDTNIQPFDQQPPRGFLQGVAVGGPVANKVTECFLQQFCPGFKPVVIDPGVQELATDSGFNFTGWTCGDSELIDSTKVGYAFVVRLMPKLTHLEGTIHLCFGMTDVGTGAALYFFSEQYTRLTRFADASYFVAFQVQLENGYRAINYEIQDLTSTALAPPNNAWL